MSRRRYRALVRIVDCAPQFLVLRCEPTRLLRAPDRADTWMVSYMFWRGSDWVLSDTCRNPDGLGFHLVVTQNGVRHIEQFESVPPMLEREHQWVETWRAHGWREVIETLPAKPRAEADGSAEAVSVGAERVSVRAEAASVAPDSMVSHAAAAAAPRT